MHKNMYLRYPGTYAFEPVFNSQEVGEWKWSMKHKAFEFSGTGTRVLLLASTASNTTITSSSGHKHRDDFHRFNERIHHLLKVWAGNSMKAWSNNLHGKESHLYCKR